MASDALTGNISIAPLDEGNYATWSVRMRCVLISKRLWSVIDKKSEEGKKASPEDQQALALIMLNCKDQYLAMLSSCETAKEAWEKLEAVHKAKSYARRLQLRKALSALKKEPTESITKYVDRARGIYNDLLSAGHTIESSEVTFCVLAGLPAEYQTVVGIIEATDKDPELDEVLPKLLVVEQRVAHEQESESKALFSKGKGVRPGISMTDKECWFCGKKGHIKAQCRQWKAKQQADGGRDKPRDGAAGTSGARHEPMINLAF